MMAYATEYICCECRDRGDNAAAGGEQRMRSHSIGAGHCTGHNEEED